MAKPTTVRFTDEVYQRLDQASARTGMPVNSIVVAACLEWMQRHMPEQVWEPARPMGMAFPAAPRWSTISRAIRQAGQARSTYPFGRFTEHAKAVLHYIGTEHLLLATLGKPDFHSAQILTALGIKEADVRSAIASVITRKEGRPSPGMIPTSRVKKVIELAFQLCGVLGQTHVGTDHILLALAAEGEGIAARVLDDLGATRKRIEAEATKLTEPES